MICRESYIIGDDKTKQISTAEFQAMVRMLEQHTALTVYNDYDGYASFIHITLHVIQNSCYYYVWLLYNLPFADCSLVLCVCSVRMIDGICSVRPISACLY